MATMQEDYYALLGVGPGREPRGDQALLPPAGARAAPGCQRRPRRGAPLPRGRRGVRGAVRPGAPRDVRPVRPRRAAERRLCPDGGRLREPLGRLRRLLRRDVLRGRRRAPGRGRHVDRTSARTSRSTSRRPPPAPSLGLTVRVARACDTCDGSGAAPGTSPITCPACNGAGRVQQVTRTVLGPDGALRDVPALRRRGHDRGDALRAVRGRRPDPRGLAARARDPRGDSRRPADPRTRRRSCRNARRPIGRRLRDRPRPAARRRRARRRRPPRARDGDDDRGRGRYDRLRAYPGRAAGRGARTRHATGHGARCPWPRDAVARDGSSRRPPRRASTFASRPASPPSSVSSSSGSSPSSGADAYRDDDDGFIARLKSAFR